MVAATDFHLGWMYLVLCFHERKFLWWRWRTRKVFYSGCVFHNAIAQHELAVKKYGNAFMYKLMKGDQHMPTHDWQYP